MCHSKPNNNNFQNKPHTLCKFTLSFSSFFCESPAQILQIHMDSALCLNFVVKWLLTFGSPCIFKSLLFHCITICKFMLLLSICVFYESPAQITVISCGFSSLSQFFGEVASGLYKSSHFLVMIVSTIMQSAKSYSAHSLSLVSMNCRRKILRIHAASVLCLKSLLKRSSLYT